MSGDIEKLFEELRAETAKRRRSRRLILCLVLPIMGSILIAWIANLIVTGSGLSDFTSFLPILSASIIAAGLYSQRQKSLIAEIAARRDPRILGHLLDAAHHGDGETRKLAESALPPILGVWLSGENEWEPSQRGQLLRLLNKNRPAELVEACLIAVRATGGLEAVPYLESLRSQTKGDRASRWQRISTRCLDALADVRGREARRIIYDGPAERNDRVEQSA